VEVDNVAVLELMHQFDLLKGVIGVLGEVDIHEAIQNLDGHIGVIEFVQRDEHFTESTS